MQFSASWLRSFINPPLSNEALAHALTMGGVEVEKLSALCCAASSNTKTAVAMPSSSSYPDDHDQIFEIKPTPNRADCLSVLGIAREIAAITGAPLRTPTFNTAKIRCAETLPVKILAPDLCGRFSARIIRNVNARAKTPDWMIHRLEQAGQRSLSALADICNYVMFELGSPSHVFDLNKIHGPLEIRWARAEESLTLLNGNTVALDQNTGVVADQQRVQSLAGIMGGAATAVSEDTHDIYIEVAFWYPDSIRGRSRRYHCLTEAAYRFERGVDYLTTVDHLEYITQLILNICGGDAGPIDDQRVNLPTRAPVTLRAAQVNRVMGIAISADDIAQILTRIGLPFTFKRDDETFSVTPPSYRFDIEIEEDLIEEVARIYGFDNIPARSPIASHVMRATDETRRSIHTIRHALAQYGYTETINFSFVDQASEHDFAGNPQPVRLLNPIASQLSVMRSTLIGSLVNTLRYNLNRKASRVRLFEIGRVFLFHPDPFTFRDQKREQQALTHASAITAIEGILQPHHIAALAYGPVCEAQWGVPARRVDFFDVKGDLEALMAPEIARFIAAPHPALHPGRSARIELNGQPVGWLGELHPQWLQKYELSQAPIIFEVDAEALIKRPRLNLNRCEVSKFPPVQRDISIIVDQKINVQTLVDVLKQAQCDNRCKHVQHIALFDLFKAAGSDTPGLAPHEKSLSFRVTLQDNEDTLREETVHLTMQTLVSCLKDAVGARIR